ncbi:MAG: hypothetical protein RIG63_29915 [Coleofasciculus chthonoplastes F3-SA18-01]|uniref:hypothetical protein n=1 Tax=Coleofasciculus chthonoplastes TaxID=64178 RepID=UPI0032F158CE
MTKGKIVLIPFPFNDLSTTQVRPAVCLTNPVEVHRHVILALITSVIPTDVMATDIILDSNDPDSKTDPDLGELGKNRQVKALIKQVRRQP